MADDAAVLTLVLDGLSIPGDPPATLADLQARLRESSPAEWRVEVMRRLLALGLPDVGQVDLCSADPGVAFACAFRSVEDCHAWGLNSIVRQHLQGRPDSDLAWLRLLLEDEVAACLLINDLARLWSGPDADEALLRRMSNLDVGPLAAVGALAALLQHPEEVARFAALERHLTAWPGWRDESAWPVRPAYGSLAAVRQQLTERVAERACCADRRLWAREALPAALAELWPPLLSFCWHCPPRRPAS